MTFQNKKILLGVTGGIAAYKSAELIRLLRKSGAEVKVVMTKSAKEFMTPLTLETLSGHPVYCDMFQSRDLPATHHISLARWADMILVAPATANFIARIAHGLANDLLSTICLSTESQIILAPAMNKSMWQNEITQSNVSVLKKYRYKIIGPAEGEQACGESGLGRMTEPEEIMKQLFQPGVFSGKKILITAGPTHEKIDPVRFIGNFSSGKMGFALANAAKKMGAEVVLVAGPVHLETPNQIKRINVISANEMNDAVMKEIDGVDIFISTAAVADYSIKNPSVQKMKRKEASIKLEFMQNPDILRSVAQLENRPFVVGFAAESDDLINNAKIKLKEKQCDMIVANLINQSDYGINSDYNKTAILYGDQVIEKPLLKKQQLADELIEMIGERCQVLTPSRYEKNTT